jgi:hypothetical protein
VSSPIPHIAIRYLFAVVLISGIVILSDAMVIFGIGFFIWGRFGEIDREAFAVQEGTPFLLLAILYCIAALGLVRVRFWAWWLALFGSLGALLYGVYRFYVSLAFIPGGGSSTPWFSSSPGGWITMVLGTMVLVHVLVSFRLFRGRVSAKRRGAQSA